MNIQIRPEAPTDRVGIYEVNLLAFGQSAEAELVDDLRIGGYVRVSLVAELAGRIVGHILFSNLAIVSENRTTAALALAPLAVLPEFQRQGIGKTLVPAGLDHCRDQGHQIVVVLGHPEYYPLFGFSPQLAQPLKSPFAGDSFMALELIPGALEGVAGRVIYAPPFGDFV